MDDELTCTYDPLVELMARFENVRAVDTSADPFEGLTVEATLQKHIVDGIKKNLEGHLDAALATYSPLQVINDVLLEGMKTVGELFGAGKMQLPFVLQSAEVMKAAVRYLEPMMERVEGSEKGSILLATVAGDVHDIGKNLVDIILSNNGYRVVNIGIKQPINNILDKAREHQVQVIGLSGLLVKSTLIMKDNLLEMNERGLEGYPVILGGAALTRGYVEEDLRALYRGRVFYAQDAFEGLRLMEEIGDSARNTEHSESAIEHSESANEHSERANEHSGSTNEQLRSINEHSESTIEHSGSANEHSESTNEHSGSTIEPLESDVSAPRPPKADRETAEELGIMPRVASHRVGVIDEGLYVFDGTKSPVRTDVAVPRLPFYGAKRAPKFDVFELYKYINTIALWRGQWQYRKPEGMSNPEFAAWLEETVRPIFERKQRELASVLRPSVKWGYFWVQSEGNDLIVYQEDAKTERCRFRFPRQRDGKRLCLSDFFKSVDSGEVDVAGFSIVTVGPDVSVLERKQFKDGDFQEYLYTHGMGVETAEALAEYWHRIMRHELGIDDDEPTDLRLLFSAKYHGARYSFGYPACPNLEDQVQLMELLQPADIGIVLTEEFMLDPEQSTSAIIVHHPEAKYFNVR